METDEYTCVPSFTSMRALLSKFEDNCEEVILRKIA